MGMHWHDSTDQTTRAEHPRAFLRARPDPLLKTLLKNRCFLRSAFRRAESLFKRTCAALIGIWLLPGPSVTHARTLQ